MQKEKLYFKSILFSLTKNNIPYILLRDDNFFNSNKKKAEWDILIPGRRLKEVKEIIKNIPNSREFKNNIDLTHPFLIRIKKGDYSIDFDFQIGGIAYCGSPILKEEYLFQNTEKNNEIFYLNKEAHFLMLLVHSFVFKKRFEYFKKYEKKFLKLYQISNKDKIYFQIEEMFGKKLTKKITRILDNKDLGGLFNIQKKMRMRHLQKNPLRIFPIFLSKLMRFRNYFNFGNFFYFINPFKWAPLIVFVGSDGSGKTTLVKKTNQYLDSFDVENKRISSGVFSKIKNPLKKTKKDETYSRRVIRSSKKKSNLELLARWIMQIPNQLKIIYFRKKGVFVITDRYVYDVVNFYGAGKLFKFLIKYLFQKPTKGFYVKVSPEKLQKRSNDLDFEAIKRVTSRIESNKNYFSLIELKNENFKKSKKELNEHLSRLLKNV